MDDKKIAELKEQHGPLVLVTAASGAEFVFRKPKRQEFDRWFDKRADGGSTAARELAQSCLVAPERAEMIAALDDQPGLLMGKNGFLDSITDHAGLGGDTIAKKL